MAWSCNGMHGNGCHLRNNPPRGQTTQTRGQDRPEEGGRRLIQLAEAGDHLWSSVLHRTSYKTYANRRGLGTVYMVPFFFSEFACDALGSD